MIVDITRLPIDKRRHWAAARGFYVFGGSMARRLWGDAMLAFWDTFYPETDSGEEMPSGIERELKTHKVSVEDRALIWRGHATIRRMINDWCERVDCLVAAERDENDSTMDLLAHVGGAAECMTKKSFENLEFILEGRKSDAPAGQAGRGQAKESKENTNAGAEKK